MTDLNKSRKWYWAFTAVITAGLLVLASPATTHAQGALPVSPMDPVGPPEEEPSPDDATKAGATEKMLSWVEADLGPKLGMKNPRKEWTVKRISLDSVGFWHFKLDQVFEGIPVKGGHLSIQLQDAAGFGEPDAHGEYLKDPEVNTKPKINAQRALAIARRLVREESGRGRPDQVEQGARGNLRVHAPEDEDASLEIHPGNGPGKRKLTFKTRVTDTTSAIPLQLISWIGAQDDNEGQVLESYNNIKTVHPIPCTGQTFYQGTASYFVCAFRDTIGNYVMEDNSLRIGVFDSYSSCTATYRTQSASTIFGNFSLSNRNTTNADVMYATVQTMSYYQYKLNRPGYADNNFGPKVYSASDGKDALLSARNHVCTNYNNAYWDGKKINIGDGDGRDFRSLATLDIIGHEWTHGVVQNEVNFPYQNEPGALDESFSDIFGAMAEKYWKGDRFVTCPPVVAAAGAGPCSLSGQIGEEAYTPSIPGDAIRYMYYPTLDFISRDHYSQRYTGTGDNGGVHFNSGIQNKAFWLLAYGGCHRLGGCMPSGIGSDDAALIFYRALRDYLIPTDGFFWARRMTQLAAATIFGSGSTQHIRTIQAWDLVGVP